MNEHENTSTAVEEGMVPEPDAATTNANQAAQPELADTTAQPEATVEDWAAALETAVRQRDEYMNAFKRSKAEFENYKKRNAGIRGESYEDGNRECIAQLLPVIDNLERATSAVEQSGDVDALLAGVNMVRKQLDEVLKKRGLAELNPLGEPFDPERDNAVARASSEHGEPGTVCDVLQKGYMVKDKMIRYAMVRVVED